MSNYLLKQTIRKLKAPIRTLQPRKPKKKNCSSQGKKQCGQYYNGEKGHWKKWMDFNIVKVEQTQESVDRWDVRSKKDGTQVSSLINSVVPFTEVG